jgi:hypothetical protein
VPSVPAAARLRPTGDGRASLLLTAIALFAGAWLVLALWLSWRGWKAGGAVAQDRGEVARLQALLSSGPAAPLLVRRDGSLTGDGRAAAWLGVDVLPADFDQLVGQSGAFAADDGALLMQHVRAAARAGAAARVMLRPAGTASILRIDVAPAPPGFGRGTALLWLLDVTVEEQRAAAAGAEAERRSQALEALSALIEACAVSDLVSRARFAVAMVIRRLCRRGWEGGERAPGHRGSHRAGGTRRRGRHAGSGSRRSARARRTHRPHLAHGSRASGG